MKFLLAALLGLVLTASGAEAQSTEAVVRQIRSGYEAVNRQVPSLKVDRRRIEGQSAEGGEVVGYYTAAGDLRKLNITHFGETGKRVQEVYFLPQKRVFALETVTQYSQPFGRPASTQQTRFYLSAGS